MKEKRLIVIMLAILVLNILIVFHIWRIELSCRRISRQIQDVNIQADYTNGALSIIEMQIEEIQKK